MSGMRECSWIPWLQDKSRSSTARASVVAWPVALFRFLFASTLALATSPKHHPGRKVRQAVTPVTEWREGGLPTVGGPLALWWVSCSKWWPKAKALQGNSLCRNSALGSRGSLRTGMVRHLFFRRQVLIFPCSCTWLLCGWWYPGYCTLLLTPSVNYMCVQMCLFWCAVVCVYCFYLTLLPALLLAAALDLFLWLILIPLKSTEPLKKKKEILTIIGAFKLLYLHFVPERWWIFQILHGNREVFQKQISCQIFAFSLQLLLRRRSTLSAIGFVALERGGLQLMQMSVPSSLWVYC